jgi:hypothetical protein
MSTVQDEARKLAYAIGLRELEPVLRRLINAERTIAEQENKIAGLQTTVLQLSMDAKTSN